MLADLLQFLALLLALTSPPVLREIHAGTGSALFSAAANLFFIGRVFLLMPFHRVERLRIYVTLYPARSGRPLRPIQLERISFSPIDTGKNSEL
jgi:hypothetical protein